MSSIQKIICAVDLSDHSALVADYASTLALAFNAEVIAVYVAPLLTQFMGLEVSTRSIDRLASEISAGAEQDLERFVSEKLGEVKSKAKMLNGHPVDEIVSFAHSSGADMIVMGTHGHRGINRILFGSVAEGVVKNSDVPVITVRPQDL